MLAQAQEGAGLFIRKKASMAAVLRYLGSRSRLLWSSSGKLGAVRRPLSSVAYPLQLATVSEQHSSWYKESIQNPERFWGDVARERLRWTKDFHTTLDCSMANARFNWFLGGQLNVSGASLYNNRLVPVHVASTI